MEPSTSPSETEIQKSDLHSEHAQKVHRTIAGVTCTIEVSQSSSIGRNVLTLALIYKPKICIHVAEFSNGLMAGSKISSDLPK